MTARSVDAGPPIATVLPFGVKGSVLRTLGICAGLRLAAGLAGLPGI